MARKNKKFIQKKDVSSVPESPDVSQKIMRFAIERLIKNQSRKARVRMSVAPPSRKGVRTTGQEAQKAYRSSGKLTGNGSCTSFRLETYLNDSARQKMKWWQ